MRRYANPYRALLWLLLAILLATPTATSGAPSDAVPLPIQRAPERWGVGSVMPADTGLRIPSLDLSHLEPAAPRLAAALPTRFDWREGGKVTPVRAQGLCSACWAFAAIANIESRLLIDGAGFYDLSENSAKECEWFQGSCGGGDYVEVANWLAQKGTVLEACDPYVPSDVSCRATCSYHQTLLGWSIISDATTPSTAALKDYLLRYGPLYAALYVGNGDAWDHEFHSYDGSYTLYYTGAGQPNHAVLLVGWDDSLPHAGGAGAWIVKNSWGTSWGGTAGFGNERGYFTIAYGAAGIGKFASAMTDWQPYDAHGGLLYYDEGGMNGAYGFRGSTTVWGVARYTLPRDGALTHVEFWTADRTTDVDIYLYDRWEGNPRGLLRSISELSFAEAGYHSVALDPPLLLPAGDEVIIALKITDASYPYPLVVDFHGPRQTQHTYMSYDGSDGSWVDLAAEATAEAGIRLRYTESAVTPTATPTATSAPPTATPTPVPTRVALGEQGWLHGRVSLQGRPLAPHASYIIPLRVELWMEGRCVAALEMMTDAWGAFTVDSLPLGLYGIRIKNLHTLSVARRDVQITPGENALDFGLLREGDATDDDAVDVLDFSVLRSAFAKSDKRADFNHDGIVDVVDFSLLRGNFGQTGVVLEP